MNIEFHTPSGKIKEWLINYLKEQLLELHKKDNEISRAEVYMKEYVVGSTYAPVCEIDLTIYGDDLQVRREADSFEQATRDVLYELKKIIEERIRKQKELPDERISTVKV